MAATIYDVAKHAGVSIATVSKVVSGRPYVSAETRERVLESIRVLHYVPSAVARGLATSRTNMVGVVITLDPHDLFADPNLMQMVYGIDVSLSERDYALLLSTARSADDRLSAYRRLLSAYRVDGAIVETGLGDAGADMLVQAGYPCIIVGHTELELPSVHPDDHHGAYQLTEHLLSLGHQRIGVITGPPDTLAVRRRFQGCADALLAAGLTIHNDWILPGTYRPEAGYDGAAHLMGLNPQPTAIFAFNDRMAFGALQWLREHGYRVPQDISVAGFDDIAEAARSIPPLTTVRQKPQEIGSRAVQMLFDQLDDQNVGSEEVVVPTELIVRQSTGTPPSDSAL